jgi:hypothetical protein
VSITGLHIPYDESAPVARVVVNQRTLTSYYPYTQGGPAEAGPLNVEGVELAAYVNSRYSNFGVEMVNKRATVLFALAGVGMWGGAVRGRRPDSQTSRELGLREVVAPRLPPPCLEPRLVRVHSAYRGAVTLR